MKISFLKLFGLLTVLMFLNPGVTFEIFPYWVIILFSKSYKKNLNNKAILLGFGVLFAFFIKFLYYSFSGNFILDTIQAVCVLIATYYYNFLPPEKKSILNLFFKRFIWFHVGVMILQRFIPRFQQFSSEFFSGRGTDLVLSALARNNAVTGLAPEPSYGSSLICGLFFLTIIHDGKISKNTIVAVIISLILFKSVFGFLIFAMLVGIFEIWRGNYRRIFLGIALIFLSFTFYLKENIPTGRLLKFLTTLIENRSILDAEKIVSPDSTRLESIISIFDFFNSNYNKSINLTVYLLQVFPMLSIFSLIFLMIKMHTKSKIIFITGLVTSIFITPLLVWPTFAGIHQLIIKSYK